MDMIQQVEIWNSGVCVCTHHTHAKNAKASARHAAIVRGIIFRGQRCTYHVREVPNNTKMHFGQTRTDVEHTL